MKHHTKDKGDKGLGFVIADLLSKDIQVSTLLSEHLPFDLIAIFPDLSLKKVSVKYRKLDINGSIKVVLHNYWADKHGTHTNTFNSTEIDLIAIYCPDTQKVYYIQSNEVGAGCINLRVNVPKNGQLKGIKWAKDYLSLGI
jgi:hypothetical protein